MRRAHHFDGSTRYGDVILLDCRRVARQSVNQRGLGRLPGSSHGLLPAHQRRERLDLDARVVALVLDDLLGARFERHEGALVLRQDLLVDGRGDEDGHLGIVPQVHVAEELACGKPRVVHEIHGDRLRWGHMPDTPALRQIPVPAIVPGRDEDVLTLELHDPLHHIDVVVVLMPNLGDLDVGDLDVVVDIEVAHLCRNERDRPGRRADHVDLEDHCVLHQGFDGQTKTRESVGIDLDRVDDLHEGIRAAAHGRDQRL